MADPEIHCSQLMNKLAIVRFTVIQLDNLFLFIFILAWEFDAGIQIGEHNLQNTLTVSQEYDVFRVFYIHCI